MSVKINGREVKDLKELGLTQEEVDELTCGARALQFGQLCCLCTVGLSCLPYCICYHKRFVELTLKASMYVPPEPQSMGGGAPEATGEYNASPERSET
jgi:hypothetical protein